MTLENLGHASGGSFCCLISHSPFIFISLSPREVRGTVSLLSISCGRLALSSTNLNNSFILIIAEVIKIITKLPLMCTNLLLLHTCMKFSRIKKSTSCKLHFRGITNILYEKYLLLGCRKLMSGTSIFFFCLVAYLKAWHRSLNIKIRSSCENVRLSPWSIRFPNLFLPYFELTYHLPSALSCSTSCLAGKTSQSPFWLTAAALYLGFLMLLILFPFSALALERGMKENKQVPRRMNRLGSV